MKRLNTPVPRKKIILIGAVVAATFIGVYVYASFNAWNGVSKVTNQYSSQTAELKNAFFSSTSEATPLRREAIAAITKKSAISCEPIVISTWQASIIQNFQDRQERCQRSLEERSQLAANAEAVAEYYRTIDAITLSIDKLTIDADKVKVESYADHLTSVQEARREVESIQITGDIPKRLQEVTITAIAELEVTWEMLIAANKAEDSAAFTGATKKMVAAYNGLAIIPDEAESGYEDVTSRL